MFHIPLASMLALVLVGATEPDCRLWEAGPDAANTYMAIQFERRSGGELPDGATFVYYYGDEEYFCSSRVAAMGYQTRFATCISADGREITSGITWIDLGVDSGAAAVFSGYVFYPGCG